MVKEGLNETGGVGENSVRLRAEDSRMHSVDEGFEACQEFVHAATPVTTCQMNSQLSTKEVEPINNQLKLTPFADIPKEDFEKMFEGLNMEETRGMGLVMPPESERNTPENQVNLEATYRELAMTRTATSHDSRTKGELKTRCIQYWYWY